MEPFVERDGQVRIRKESKSGGPEHEDTIVVRATVHDGAGGTVEITARIPASTWSKALAGNGSYSASSKISLGHEARQQRQA